MLYDIVRAREDSHEHVTVICPLMVCAFPKKVSQRQFSCSYPPIQASKDSIMEFLGYSTAEFSPKAHDTSMPVKKNDTPPAPQIATPHADVMSDQEPDSILNDVDEVTAKDGVGKSESAASQDDFNTLVFGQADSAEAKANKVDVKLTLPGQKMAAWGKSTFCGV